MSGSLAGHMFTIEQIELIRRLRNSGITKEQVIQAFDSFDRLSQDLGQLYNVPVTQSSQNTPQNTRSQARYSLSQSLPQNLTSSLQNQYRSSQASQQYSTQRAQPAAGAQSAGLPRAINTPPLSSSSSVFPVAITANPRTIGNQYQERQGVKRPHIETIDLDPEDSIGSHDDESNNSNNATNSGDDLTTEVRDFLRQGNEKAAEEIRRFIGTHDIRQGDLSSMTGQSITTVDQFLQGDIREVPAQAFKDICTWYINYSKTVSVNMLSLPFPGQKIKIASGQEVIIPHQRRERFTFREKHLEVLESCFNENPYPSQDQRDVIAQMCNTAVSNMGTRMLHEREKVSPHMVLNWFANRRKEVKRIAREEGIPESEVVLPSKINKKENYAFDVNLESVQLSPISGTLGEQSSDATIKLEPG